MKQARTRREALERAHLHIGSLVDGARAGELRQRRAPEFAKALRARREDLHHHRRVVAVGDEPRKAVGLAMHEAHRVAARGKEQAPRDRGLQAAANESLVDRLRRIEGPDARADLRIGAVGGAREEGAVLAR